ncbi:FAD-binding protein [Georgenia ruanii]|uniref:FAD-binding protein n=2 Tax=Georgenia ruanii TaxID=348442 RepID=A0A7J9UZ57_9MICO|nr:FAD-binding protein [Georgenia ruanii]
MSSDMPTGTTTATDLRAPGAGAVHLPGDPGYDTARQPWSIGHDQRPAAVAAPTTAAEVAAVVRRAAAAGLRVAPQGTGHNAGPLAAQDLSDVVLLRTGALDEVTIDPATRRARVGAGVIWQPAVEAAAAHGLAALHGSSPDVGLAGYSLGGGIGWYARQLGLAANSLTAVELITADGELVRADRHENAELFWALRGGGGGLGAVTALEFRLYPIDSAYAGMLMWDVADAEKVLRTWAAWAPTAPDEITTAFRLLKLPPLPELPEPVRGRHLAVVDGAVLASDERATELLAELRALRPEIDTFARIPAPAVTRIHMDPEGPTPSVSDAALLGSAPDGAIDGLLAQMGPGSTSTLLMAELRQLGGALGRRHEGGGALDRLDAAFTAYGVAIAPTPEMAAAGADDARALIGALSPWANGRQYLNYAENVVDPRTGFDADTWAKLSAIRASVDPGGMFVANHAVGREPATS